MVIFYIIMSLWFHFYRYQYVRRGDQFTMPWPKPKGYEQSNKRAGPAASIRRAIVYWRWRGVLELVGALIARAWPRDWLLFFNRKRQAEGRTCGRYSTPFKHLIENPVFEQQGPNQYPKLERGLQEPAHPDAAIGRYARHPPLACPLAAGHGPGQPAGDRKIRLDDAAGRPHHILQFRPVGTYAGEPPGLSRRGALSALTIQHPFCPRLGAPALGAVFGHPCQGAADRAHWPAHGVAVVRS